MHTVNSFINTIKEGNCIELMSEMPDECVDLIVTDPPFAIDFKATRQNYNRKESHVLQGYNEVKSNEYLDFTLDWLSGATRVLKDSGSMYVFSGWNHLKDLLIAIDHCELTTINHLVWKYQFGVVTKRKYVTSHYHCLFVCKNDEKRKFYPYCRFDKDTKTKDGGSAHYRDKEDVWEINREYWNRALKTPTKLPAELIVKILDYSSEKGDLVFDPFLGSGQVAVVSQMKKRNYVGFEIVPEYYQLAQNRLESGEYLVYPTKKEEAVSELFATVI
ncbi:MAG: site-specific DNA-methyltransferase [Candidatus Poribacteria bacterium]|nr:site-specific DNA-methyltransferase [Candidatus Poribacteria bacterium]